MALDHGVTYERNALRIGKLLEEQCPSLRSAGKGCDFRPDGHPERICSGVMARTMVGGFAYSDLEDVSSPTSLVNFKVLYGGWEKCLEGIAALMGLGINFSVRSPGEGKTWRLEFSLPQNWRIEG